ncbi:MAG: hypothetical protein EPN25_10265 [Nitrospirae bacterium]|nr:MAG: hypothetical protein EPN25_10265 [Nitrospirota bacterium]
MSKVIAYENTDRVCFCQIKFSSRERILVSIATVPEHSIKVIKLLAGIIPYRTIWEFNATKAGGKDTHTRLIAMFTGQTASGTDPEKKVDHPLDAIIRKLVACRSCNEAVCALQQAEKTYRNN